MSSYRIVIYSNPFWVCKNYKVQKKSFFGLWYNFNSDAYPMNGHYDTEAKARKAIERHRSKTTVEIINLEQDE